MVLVKELRIVAKDNHIKNYSKMKKAELLEALREIGITFPEEEKVNKTKKTTKQKSLPKNAPKDVKRNVSKNVSKAELEKMKVVELKQLCKQMKLSGYSKMKKAELVDFILASLKKEVDECLQDFSKSLSVFENDSQCTKIIKEHEPVFTSPKARNKVPPSEKKQLSPKPIKRRKEIRKTPHVKAIKLIDTEKTKRRKRKSVEAPPLKMVKKIPFDYQLRVVEHLKRFRGVIAAHGTGSGKTFLATMSIMWFLKQYPKQRAIIVTPKSLQGNMRDELTVYQHFFETPEDMWERIEIHTIANFGRVYASKWKECRQNMLVIDEAHNLKKDIKIKGSEKEKDTRAKTAVQCARMASKVLLLTATPIMNYPEELINLMAMVRGEKPKTKVEFKNILANDHLFHEYFKNTISMYYPKKTDRYPAVKRTLVDLVMAPNYYRKYVEIERKLKPKYKELSDFFYSAVRMASNSIDEDSPKLDWVVNFIKAHPNKKIVIYSSFKANGIFKIKKEIEKMKQRYVEITGETEEVKRFEAVRIFNDDSNKVNFFLITNAGGEGLDLKGTYAQIKFEASWNPMVEEQIEGRVVRFDSHTHLPKEEQIVYIYDLVARKPNMVNRIPEDTTGKDSADVILKNLSKKKKEIIDAMFNRLLPYTIEQYKSVDSQHERNMMTLKNMPLDQKGNTAYDLYMDLMIARSAKYQTLVDTRMMKRYMKGKNLVLRKQFQSIYPVKTYNAYGNAYNKDNMQYFEGGGTQYVRPYGEFGTFYFKDLINEKKAYYLVLDIYHFIQKFQLGNFEYIGYTEKGRVKNDPTPRFYLMWKNLDTGEETILEDNEY